MAIDQTKVDGMPLDIVRTLTVGPEGTFSTVQILRGDRCVYMYVSCIYTGVSFSLRELVRHVFQTTLS